MSATEAREMTVGQRIRWARHQIDLSQERLARRLGTTRQVVIRWEKGKHLPNQRSRRRLSRVLGQPPGFFHDADEEAG